MDDSHEELQVLRNEKQQNALLINVSIQMN